MGAGRICIGERNEERDMKISEKGWRQPANKKSSGRAKDHALCKLEAIRVWLRLIEVDEVLELFVAMAAVAGVKIAEAFIHRHA